MGGSAPAASGERDVYIDGTKIIIFFILLFVVGFILAFVDVPIMYCWQNWRRKIVTSTPRESGQSSLEQSVQINIREEVVDMKSPEECACGADMMKECDVNSTKSSTLYMRDRVIDLTDTDEEILPPRPSSPLFIGATTISSTAVESPNQLRSVKAQVFTYASLQQYTTNFSVESFIGSGILGSVYRANLPDHKVLAVKKLESRTCRHQSDEEFLDLVSNIFEVRHANIVQLVGYCIEHGQRLLVYDEYYCSNGTLCDALHNDNEIHRRLTWSVRIHIALGAARALEYLHEVCKPPMVHQMFNSASLLLDQKLHVRVSDCSLAPLILRPSVASTSEFVCRCCTQQSDVYSFGVVMLELLTGRKAYDRSRPPGERYLVQWAIPKLHDIEALSRMVDPSLNEEYSMKSLSYIADIIYACLQATPEFRPPISKIVQDLLRIHSISNK